MRLHAISLARTVGVLAASLACIPLARAEAPGQAHGLVGFVAILDRAEPVSERQLYGLFGREPHCSTRVGSERMDCDARDVEVAGAKIDSLDFRSGAFGSLLILKLGNLDCLEARSIDQMFGQGVDRSGCTDGVACIYRLYQRKWGRLSLGIGADQAAADCASTIVFDADPT